MMRSDYASACKLQSWALVLHQMSRLIPSLILCLTLAAQLSHGDSLPERPRAVLNQQLVPDSAVTVVVRDVTSGESLVDLNATALRQPASTMKLVPTWAALELLGPAYTWKTRAYSDAPVVKGVLKGNLYLQGGGDPLLTIERWWRFVADLRQKGLRVIDGDIVIDQTRFAALDERPEDFDGRAWRTYNVLPDALLVNWQSADFVVRPSDDGDRVEVAIEPYPYGLVVENRAVLTAGRCAGRNRRIMISSPDHEPQRITVTGQMSASCAPQTYRRAIMEPADYAYGTFVTLWRQQGGEFKGGMLRAPTPPTARLLLTQESQPLAEIVRVTNKYSSNVMARTLLLTIAAEAGGTPATAAAGEASVRDMLASRGIDLPDIVVGNGSGLSREARISGDGMAQLLISAWKSRYAPEFLASLSLGGLDGTLRKRFEKVGDPGRIRMKTGTLNNVSTIAGYVTGDSGKHYAVVVFVNHPGVQNGVGELIQGAVIEWVLRQ
jgi:serine-type D-Ala-D-Ala carboxypeptidase/endopeptidase (penicillin-binding protein 4)